MAVMARLAGAALARVAVGLVALVAFAYEGLCRLAVVLGQWMGDEELGYYVLFLQLPAVAAVTLLGVAYYVSYSRTFGSRREPEQPDSLSDEEGEEGEGMGGGGGGAWGEEDQRRTEPRDVAVRAQRRVVPDQPPARHRSLDGVVRSGGREVYRAAVTYSVALVLAPFPIKLRRWLRQRRRQVRRTVTPSATPSSHDGDEDAWRSAGPRAPPRQHLDLDEVLRMARALPVPTPRAAAAAVGETGDCAILPGHPGSAAGP